MKDKELTVAEQVVLSEMRRWPTLYRCERSFYHQCIVGMQGRWYWKKGLLHSDEKTYDVTSKRFVKAPFRMSKELALSLRLHRPGFFSVDPPYTPEYSPLYSMPDDMDESWQDFIGFHLYMDLEITPELYETIVECHCIIHYGIRDNPNANMQHYKDNWADYYAKITHYRERLNVIKQIQETGKIPAGTYVGMHI